MERVAKTGILFLAVLLFQNISFGQQGAWKLTPSYSVALPTGNFKNLVNETSFRGWSVDVMYGLNDKTSLGLSSGFQDFYQRYPREVLHGDGSDISAVITNSIQVIPIMLKAKHVLSNEGTIQPYASLAAGGNVIHYQKYYGQFVDGNTKFGFAAQPEIGLDVPLGPAKRMGLNVAAAYNYMPFKYNDADGLNNIALKVGLRLPLQR